MNGQDMIDQCIAAAKEMIERPKREAAAVAFFESRLAAGWILVPPERVLPPGCAVRACSECAGVGSVSSGVTGTFKTTCWTCHATGFEIVKAGVK